MTYGTSYDAGLKPFNHDKQRGKWASPMDFVFTCIGHAFKMDAMLVVPALIFQDLGFYALIPYCIIMLLCTVPIIFMQSFLGQFSSTGFISVFRIAPLFKGIGYVSLAINILTLTYYSIFAAIPLFYFVHSLRPTLPWSCEGITHWFDSENKTTPCNTTEIEHNSDEYGYIAAEVPSMEFLAYHLNIVPWKHDQPTGVTFSWSLILCSLVIWFIVWSVLKNRTEQIGRIIRYASLTMVAMLSICVIRFAFLPGAISGLTRFFKPQYLGIDSIFLIPLMALHGLGPGWGTILTMASYNNFKDDITKNTWILGLGQFGLMMLVSFSCIFIQEFFIDRNPEMFYLNYAESQWMKFLSIPTALSLIEFPHFWSILFFGMLALGATNLLIVQLFSVLTALFDEYEQLRSFKKQVTRIVIGLLALASILFCSNHGVIILEFMAKYTIITQMFLNLMLILVVFWIYGRERLQRDVHFMTQRIYSTWMVYIMRFVAPIFLLISFLLAIAAAIFIRDYSITILCIIFLGILLLWLLIPGYCIFKLMETSGLLVMRFKRCIRPMDWYPADSAERQRYEETLSNSEIEHQLTTATEEDA